MIDIFGPLELDRFGHEELAYPIVDVGFVGLAELVAALHAVESAILDELSPRLVKAEGDVALHALLSEREDPPIVAGPRLHARLAAHAHLLDRSVEVWEEIYSLKHRRDDDALVLDGQGFENGQPIVGHGLVLDGAAHQHIVVALAPVVGEALHEAVDALGEEIEPEVAPFTHHLPALAAPRVGILEQEVGGEAGEDHHAALELPRLVATAFQREIEVGGLACQAACHRAAIHLILAIDVAILAARAHLGTTVPRVPIGINLPVLAHTLPHPALALDRLRCQAGYSA